MVFHPVRNRSFCKNEPVSMRQLYQLEECTRLTTKVTTGSSKDFSKARDLGNSKDS
ncbi:unnamed protein product, partial [Allacma fusca]